METNQTNCPYCESCAMPLNKPEDFGTEADGSKSKDYCQYCYKDGKFTNDMTMEEMVDYCVPYVLDHYGGDKEKAKAESMKFYPKLKRWAQA